MDLMVFLGGEALRLPKWRVSLAPPRWFVMFPQLQTEPNYGFKKSSIFTFATCKLAWKNLQKILGKVLNNSSQNGELSSLWKMNFNPFVSSGIGFETFEGLINWEITRKGSSMVIILFCTSYTRPLTWIHIHYEVVRRDWHLKSQLRSFLLR